jgi:N-acetylglucosaminyl-diphospho-decaprenol L-rhamnosyltransferase
LREASNNGQVAGVEHRKMKLLVVIANYRVADLTIDCLRSLADEIARVPGTHVAVCENGTGDDSADRIQKAITVNGWNSWCTLKAVSVNLGFTGGNNVILAPALGSKDPPQYVLLLNADTIVRANALKALVDFMEERPDVGIAGSGLEYPDGTPQNSAFRFLSPMSELDSSLNVGVVSRLLRRWVIALPIPKLASEVDWVAGASMIIRREVFGDVGILDEGYYTQYEDIDFCFNARKKGWTVWYVPSSRVTHLVGQSTGLTVRNPKRFPPYYFEARRRYFLKNHGVVYAALADAGLIVGLALWRLRVFFGKKDFTAPHLLRDSIRHSVFLTGFKLRNVENPALALQRSVLSGFGTADTVKTPTVS